MVFGEDFSLLASLSLSETGEHCNAKMVQLQVPCTDVSNKT